MSERDARPGRRRRFLVGWIGLLLAGGLTTGCDRWWGTGRTGGEAGRWTRIESSVTAPAERGDVGVGVTNAWLSVIQTEWSPATLWRSTGGMVRMFGDLARLGLGGPTFLAYSSPTGIAVLRPGQGFGGGEMRENWLLTGFPGADGWEAWDSPWAVFFERKPERVELDEDGVVVRFCGEAGSFASMPLYGYYKPPQRGQEVLTAQGLKEKGLLTWEWPTVVARDPLTRLRYWAGVTRRFPIGMEETVRVDARRGAVVIRQTFRWLEIGDDWGTRPIVVAPVSPTLGLVLTRGQSFPVAFSSPPFDFEIATPYGPFFGVPGVGTYEMRFQVLEYVDETEAQRVFKEVEASDAVRQALARVRDVGRRLASEERGGEASWKAVSGDPAEDFRAWEWIARGLPYYDDASRDRAGGRLKRQLEGWLGGRRMTEADAEVRDAFWGALWAYTRFSGDETVLRAGWPEWRGLVLNRERGRWVTLGGRPALGVGDGAAGAIAVARLAFLMGDGEVYNVACGRVARELVRMQVRVRGTSWFREQQPWHSLDPIGETEVVSDLGEGMVGWRLEPLRHASGVDPERVHRRWGHLAEPAVGRFLGERMAGEAGREMRRLLEGVREGKSEGGLVPVPADWAGIHGLLVEALGERSASGPGEEGRLVPELAGSLVALRVAAGPARFGRWIGDAPSFGSQAGYGDGEEALSAVLVQSVGWDGSGRNDWPSVPGWPWKTPSGHPWSVGTLRVGSGGTAGTPERVGISPGAVQWVWPEAR